MSVLCVIPARLGSTRLPRKPLALIQGKPLIQRTYAVAAQCADIDKVIVATDSQEIIDVVNQCGGEALLTPTELKTGTDRVAFVAQEFPHYDIVINFQGDEPFARPAMLSDLIKPFAQDSQVLMSTLGSPLDFTTQYNTPDIVKVICDINNDAIYFSRAPIPYFRQPSPAVKVLHHKGIYAFRREFLLKFAQLPQTPLEIAESLEQLRALEHGVKIRVCQTPYSTLEINTPEELAAAQVYSDESSLA